MPTNMKVALVGATGETGQSIVKGLLESPTNFEIKALVRETSLQKPATQELQKQGIEIVTVDILGSQDALVKALKGVDVIVSTIAPWALHDQIPLADAAKQAGVKRFVPCCFGTACAPRGVMALREAKEDVLDHIKKIYLPYTIIDVGWWYQIGTPKVPSGKLDYAILAPVDILGDGNVPLALTDLRDVGRYVARVIADDRTLNKHIFAYNEVMTQQEVFKIVEEKSGEQVERTVLPADEIRKQIGQAQKAVDKDSKNLDNLRALWTWQYRLSWGIRGDNTPEYARYLGYLFGKDLYPDFEFTSYGQYVDEILDGKGKAPYL